jgi:uncharacterized damage-inducible protein DinB
MDQKPPREIGDERATLQSLLQYKRDAIVRKVEGLSDEEARRSPVPSGTSLLWLVQHLVYAETIWVLHRFDGQELELPANEVRDGDTLAGAVEAYRRTWERVDAIVAAASLDDRCKVIDVEPSPDLRWVLAHLLEETARHAGHADILRELIDGATGR